MELSASLSPAGAPHSAPRMAEDLRSSEAAAELERLRQRASQRKGDLASEEDNLRRERKNLMKANKKASVREHEMAVKIERLEKENGELLERNRALQDQLQQATRRAEAAEASETDLLKAMEAAGKHREFAAQTAQKEEAWRRERESLNHEKARLVDAHVQDMVKLKKELERARENDMQNFRLLLAEEREKGMALKQAWKGVLGGTHDAELKYTTQRLSTGKTLTHITACTVRETGKGPSAQECTPRSWDDMTVMDRMRMSGRMSERIRSTPRPTSTKDSVGF